MGPNLAGKICCVTGASRGIGRGIALQLGRNGATVYITGRSGDKLVEVQKQIQENGGKAVVVKMDHNMDQEVKDLFDRIGQEQGGIIHLLVNNVYGAVDELIKKDASFWEADPAKHWDLVNGVGLRNHYLCTAYASRMMVKNKEGLIVNISSMGGLTYLFDPAYGVGKAAMDRMAADCAVELRRFGVSMISLWPGPVETEKIAEVKNSGAKMRAFDKCETVEFSGKAISHLLADPEHQKASSGKVCLNADLAFKYGFKEDDGTVFDPLNVQEFARLKGWEKLSWIVPSFIRVPKILLQFVGYKF